MGKHEKTLAAVVSGTSNANVPFDDLCHLLPRLGFSQRVGKGSHGHIFARRDIAEIVNLQPARDGKAKSYQVKQVALIIKKYTLSL